MGPINNLLPKRLWVAIVNITGKIITNSVFLFQHSFSLSAENIILKVMVCITTIADV